MSAYARSASAAHEITLDNGLHVVCERDDRIPYIACRLSVLAGARYDESLPGLAHLCEHIACKGPTSGDLSRAERLYRAGGSTNGWTSQDDASFADFVPASQAVEALAVAAERLRCQPAWLTDEGIQREAQTLIREHQERSNTLPYNRELESLQRLMYPPGHPYHWPAGGTPESIRRITRNDAIEFFRRWYTPGRSVLAVVGDVDPGRLFRQSEIRLGAVAPGATGGESSRELSPPLDDASHALSDVNVPYIRAYVAYRLPGCAHAGWMSGPLVARAVALGRSSPLRRDLIRRGIAHDVRVYIEPRGEATTVAFVATAPSGVSRVDLETGFVEALDRVIAEDVHAGDVERARTSERIAYYIHSDKLAVRAERLAKASTLRRGYGTADDLDSLQHRSSSSILADGRNMFTTTQRLRLSVGPGRRAS